MDIQATQFKSLHGTHFQQKYTNPAYQHSGLLLAKVVGLSSGAWPIYTQLAMTELGNIQSNAESVAEFLNLKYTNPTCRH